MRQFYLLVALLVLSLSLSDGAKAQSCVCSVDPTNSFVIDLSSTPDTTVTRQGTRDGLCCGASNPDRCIKFYITVHPNTAQIGFTVSNGNNGGYRVDCGPVTSPGTPLCVNGLTTFCVTYCNPGGNSDVYTISVSSPFGASADLKLRSNGCSGVMTVTGLTESTVNWTSIAPGAVGAYNSFLSTTTGSDSVTVTPTSVVPGGFVDYRVCGTTAGCASGSVCDTVRVYTYSGLTVAITPPTPTVCTGGPTSVQLTATPTGGNAPYTYSWTGPGGFTSTSATPTVSTAGVYTVAVTDNTDCPPVQQTVTVNSYTTPAVNSAATGSTCSGIAQNYTITATVPGTTFSWSRAVVTGISNGAVSGQTANPITESLVNTTSASIDVVYLITPTANGCVGSVFTYTVTVNPTPVVTNLATASTCSGTSPNLTLTASVASTFTWTIGTITGSITGASASSGGTINQVLTNPSTTTAGSVQYLVTPTSVTGSCVGSPYTITVTVNPRPTVTNGATASTCSGAGPNITLTSSAPSTFAWTIGTITGGITGASAGSGGTINQALTNPSNSTAGTVQYNITPTSVTGSCVGPVHTITVTVNPTPAVTNLATASACSGAGPNITLTSSAPSTFAWTIGTITGGITGASAGSGGTINQTLTNPSSTTAGTVEYVITPTSVTGSCVGSPYTITVTVNPTPAVTTPNTASTCSGTNPSISLTATTPSTFAWTIGTITGAITGASAGSGSTINQILTNPSNSTAGSVQYLVTPTSVTGSCVGPAYTITVTVNPTPSVTNLATASNCSGFGPNITLTASAPSTFAWTIGTITGGITGASNASGGTINQALTNPSNSAAGSVQYLVTPTSVTGSCVGTPFTITVTVNPTPAVTNSLTAATCSGTGPNITLAASVSSTFTWTLGTNTGGITGASAGSGGTINQTLTNPSTSTAGSIQYIVTPTSVTGSCVGPSSTITVTVNPRPVVTNAATLSTCSGTNPSISLTASAPSTFAWTVGTITGGITGANAGSGGTINDVLTNPSNSTAGTVQYVITPTSVTGSCVGTPYTITVTVNPTPSVTTAATASTCNATGPNISLTATAPSTFAWTIGTITGGITGASAGSGSTINQTLTNPSNSTAGTVQYIVTPTSVTGSCAGAPYTITVTVNPTPAVTNTATASICHSTSPNITLTSSAPSTFAWTLGTNTGGITGASAGSGGTINQTLSNPSNSTAGSIQYIVTPTSVTGSCVGAPYTITVTVNPRPAVTNAATTSICSGTGPNITLTASAPSSFAWTIGTVTGGITGASAGSGGTINQTLTNPSNSTAGSVQYLVTPTSTTGSCVGVPYTITVTVNPTPAVTNAITASICNATSPNITLTASAPSTFAWTIGTITGGITGASAGSGGTINQTLTNPSNSTAGSVQYIVTPTSVTGSCVGAPHTITITVNPTPAVTNASTTSTCSATSPNITLAASAPSTFAWTIGTITGGITGASAGSGGTINQTLTNPSTSTAGSVQYNVTPTSVTGSCVGAPYTITVTVNPRPVVTNAATIAICNATGPNITLTSSAPSTFTWTIGTITGGITGASAGSGGTINQTLTNPSNSIAGSVQYVITPTSVTGSCVGTPYTITVTVNPTPAVTNAPTASICNATSPNITLTSSAPSTFAWTIGTNVGGITGASAGSGGTINQTLNNPSNSTAGSVQYIVTPTSVTGSCAGAPYTITITVNPTPAVTNAATMAICSGTNPSISLTSSAPSTFAWTIGAITGSITGASAGSGSTINQTLTNPSNSTAGSVQYIVTPTAVTGSCVGAPYTITVTVNPTPAVSNAATAAICNATGPNLTLAATAPSTFAWTIGTITGGITGASAGSGGTINQTLTNPSSSTAGTVQYLVTPTSVTGSCVGAPYTITITVNPTPVVTNSATATICNATGPNITLTASAPSTFAWTIGTNTGGITGASAGSGGTINQTLTNPSNSTAGSIQYIITPTSVTGSCVGAPFTITVTVNPTPAVTNAASAAICSGANPSIILAATAPSTFSWTIGTVAGGITGASAGTGATINQTLTNPSTSTAGSVQYIVTPTSVTGSCVGAPYTITITVNPRPVVTNTATAAICNGTGPNITLTASAPSTFDWTVGTITGGITGASAGSGSTINQVLTNPSSTTAGSVQYIITPTSVTGSCAGTPYTITVTVNPTPTVTNSATASICNGTSPNIALTASAPSTFAWTIGTITGGITGASAGSGPTINQTLTNPSNATAGTVEYLVTPTSTGGTCPGSTAYVITITVNPTPAITGVPATVAICNNTTTNIPLTATAPSTFAWTIGSITGSITGASAGTGSTIAQTLTNPSNSAAGTVQYLVTPTSTAGNCPASTSYTVTVTVNPTPAITGVPATAAICNNTATNIPLTATAPSTFAWTIGTITGGITGASAASGNTIAQTLINPSNTTAGTVQYLVTPTSTGGNCPSSTPYTITVTVNPTPQVTGVPASAAICSNAATNIPLSATVPSTFAWTIGTITGGITGASAGSGSTITQTLTNPSNATAGTVQYLVTPTSTGGLCPASSAYTITVTVNPRPVITGVPATASICNNTATNIPLTATAPSTFAWTIGTITGGITGASAGSGSTIAQTLINPSNSTAGSVQYLVTPTSTGGGCVANAPYTITVTVDPTPAITGVPATAAICNNTATNIPLTATAPSSFAWTIGTIAGGITGASAGSGSTIAQTLTNPSNATAGTVEYLVTPTSTVGTCPASAPYVITVTVNPTPAITGVPATAAICNNTATNIPLTATAPSTFAWTIGAITGSISGASAGSGNTITQTLTNPSNSTSGTVQYLVTPTSTGGNCPASSSYTITVTVNPTPAITGVPATVAICNNTATNIPLAATAPSTFAWTIGNITGGITGASAGSGNNISQTLINPSNATAGTVEYLVTPTSTGGNCPASAAYTITVTVNPTPAISGVPATSAICSGASTNITLAATAPSTFAWTIGTITGGITGATAGSGNTIAQALTNPSNATAGTVEYLVTPTSTVGNCPASSVYTITVTVNPRPVITGVPATAAICNNAATNIPLTATAPSTFAWTIGTITGSITGASAGSGNVIAQTLGNPSNTTAGTVQYLVTPTSTGGSCVANAPYTITVTVNPTPAITGVPATAAICNNTATNIPLTATAPSTFAWTIGTITGGITGATAGSGNTIAQILANPSNTTAGTVEYLVTPTSTTGGCAASTPYTITVTVNPTPAITGVPATATICSDASTNIPLTATAPSTFAWTIGNITGGITGATAGSGNTIAQALTNPGNATAGTVEYLVTPTSIAGSCPASGAYSITVTVNPRPVITGVPATAAICNNTATNIPLTATAPSTFAWTIGTITGSITGASAGSGNTIAQTLGNPSNTTAGTVQYLVTPTSTVGSCAASAPYTITVTVNPTPAIAGVPATVAICNNTATNIPLTATAPSTFAWTIGTVTGGITGAAAGSGNTISQTLINPSNSTAGTVEYLVIPTSTTGNCPASAAYVITVTVNPTPAVTNPSTAVTCSGTSPNIVLASSTGSTFSWSIGAINGGITGASAGSGGTINQVLTNPSNSTAGSVEYIITPTSTGGTCPGTPYTITVTVNPRPIITGVPASVAICNNTATNIPLTATAPSTFTWTIGTITGSISGASAGSGNTIAQTLTNPSNTTAGTVEYLVTPTSTGGGCVANSPYTITVTVNPTPAISGVPAAVAICNNTATNIPLTATAPSTFAWTIGTITGGITGASAGSGNTIVQTLVNPSNSTAGTVEYLVTPTSTTGSCPASAAYVITVTVNPTPQVTGVPSTAAICSNTATNISLSATAPSTFSWTIGTITGGVTGASAGSGNTITQTLSNPSNSTVGTVEYLVTPTSTGGFCPASAPYTITVSVNPLPAVTNTPPAAICNGGSPNISLTATVPSTFTWTIGTINGGITGASAGSGNLINQALTNPSAVSSGTVEYIVTPTSLNGCVGTAFSIVATVTVYPTPVVTSAPTAVICSNDQTNIALTSSNPSTFNWTIGAITGGITGASAGAGNTIAQSLTNPSNATAGTVEYVVIPTSSTGSCQGPAYTITVTVNPRPVVTGVPASVAICNNTATNIPLSATAPSTFAWTIGTITGGITGASAGSGNTIAQTLLNPSNSVAGSVEYVVTPTSTGGNCAASAPYIITVTVNPTPQIIGVPSSFAICNNTATNIALNATAMSTFSWTIGTINGSITGASAGSGNTIAQTLTNPSNATAGTVEYLVTPTSTVGNCPASAAYSIIVTVHPTPAVTGVPASVAICNNTATNIPLTASAPSSFTWTIGTITGGITGASAGSGASIAQTLSNPSNATPGTVEYLVSATSTAGTCPASAPYVVTVTVNPTPVVTGVPATVAICNNTATNIPLSATAPSTFAWTIGAITGSISGASAGTGNAIAQTLTNPSNATAGTVEYLVTPTSTGGNCPSSSPYSIIVTVNPTPVVTGVPSAVAICNNTATNIALAATAPSTFAWTIGNITGTITGASAGSGNTIAQTLTNPSNATAGTVEYLVTPTSTGGNCPASAPYTITVTVNPTPVVTGVPATVAICNNTATNIPLTATAPSTFAWTVGTITGGITGASDGSGATIAQTLTNPSNATAGTVEYLVTPTSTGGNCPASAAYTITVTVNPTPVVTGVPSTVAICNNTATNIALNATAPSSFAWTIGTITGSISGSSAGSGNTIAQTLANPSNSTAGTVEYLVTPTSTGGNCPASAPYSIIVTVNPTPVVTGVPSAVAICNNTATNIPLTATAPSTFAWTIGTITGGITGASASSGNTIGQTLSNPSNATAGSVEYLVTPTSTGGTCPASAPYIITVTVNPTPVVTGVPATDTICNNTATNIPLTATAPSTFAWTIGTITGGITGASNGSGATIAQTLSNPSNATAGTVEYLVTPTSTVGNCPASAPYTITVTVSPTPVVTGVPATFAICNNTATNIPLNATAPSTFAWTIGTITGSITGASAGTGNTIAQTLTNPNNTTAGTVEYLVTPTSTAANCPASAPYSIIVTVNPTPVVTGVPSSVAICNNTSTNIPLTASAPSTFAWTIGAITGGITGATAASGSTIAQTLSNPSNATTGTVEYLVTPTSTGGNCVASAPYTITVSVNPTPVVTGVPATDSICNNAATNIPLTASVPSTFTWTIGTVTGGITGAAASNGGTITQTLINPSNVAAGTVEYLVVPTSVAGNCPASAPYTVTVTVLPTPSVTGVPSTFAICNNTATNIPLNATVPSTFTWTIGTITGGISGASAGTGNTIAQTLTNPGNTTAGTVQYLITPTSTVGSCPASGSYTVTVTVNPTPVVTGVPATFAICNNTATNIPLSASTPSTFAWTIGTITGGITGATASSGGTIAQTLNNPSNATAGTVEYLVTPTSTGGTCPASAPYTITVTVDPTPVITGVPATDTICNNTATNIPLSATAPSTFAWTIGTISGGITGANPGSGNTIAQTLTNPSNATAGSVEYHITPTSTVGNCPAAAPYIITVTVLPTPVLTGAPATVAICNNTATSIPLNASAPSTFAWTIGTITGGITGATPGTGDTIAQTLTNPSNVTAGTVEYLITPTSTTGNCPASGAYSIVVTVNPTPLVTSAATGVICSGGTINYTITSSVPGATYAWGRGAVAGISNPAAAGQTSNPIIESLTNTTSVPINVTYVITPIANGCAGPTFNYVVTVDPTPTVTSAATGVVCSGTAQNYNITSAVAGATYTWTRNAVAGISNPAVTGQTANPITETLINTTAAPVNVDYLITPSANGCVTGPVFTYTVTVNPTPVVTSSGTNTICNNTAQNYTITTATTGTTFTWDRAVVAGISNAAATGQTINPITETLVNTTNAPVNVTYSIVPSANGCANPVPFDYIVTVNPTATITSSGVDTVCSNEAQNAPFVSAVAGTTYSWTRATVTGISNTASSGTSNPITESLVNTTSAPIDVTYVVTPSANGCANPVPFNYVVTVNPTPTVTSAAAATVCSGDALGYSITSAVAGTTFSWTRAAVSGISNPGVTAQTSNPITEALVNTTNAAVNVTYTIIPTANGCSGPAFNFTAIVNPRPTISSAATGTVCSGEAQNYTITSPVTGATYVWDRAAVAGISNAAVTSQAANPITETLVNTTNAPVNVTYVITPSASGCVNTPPFSYVVTVNPRPVVTSTGNGVVCSGDAQNYTLTSPVAGTTYSWTRAAVAGITEPASAGTANPITEVLTNTTTAAIDVTYNVTPIANGCVNPVPFVYTVRVNPSPVVTSANAGTVCSEVADSYTITSGVAGSTFSWSRATVAGISNAPVIGQTSNPINESLTNTTTTTVNVTYVIIASANGCNGPAFNYTKAVKPTPPAPTVGNNGPLCVGANLQLTASSTPGATYDWTGPNGFVSTLQNPTRPGVTFADDGIYRVTATVNGCVSPVSDNPVVVSNAPATANAGPNQIICAGNPVAVAGTITGGSISGIWTTSGTGTFSPSNTSLNALYNPSPADTAAGAVLLTLTTTNTGSCAPSSSSLTVTITDAPVANAGADTTICAYKTVSLNGGISIATGGLWSTSGTGTFDPSPNALNATYTPSAADIASGSVTLTLVTTGTGNCITSQDQKVVTIIPAPIVNAGADKYVLLGDSYTLQPTTTGPVTSYSWTPGSWLNSTTIANPVTRPLDDITYIVTVTGPGGCTSTDSVAIIVLPPPEIPNVFTPNGDGVHDKWVIRELTKYPDCKVQVFTRYGQLIFNNQGYDQPWDGTSNGKALPAGTYYYVIEPGHGRPRFSGYVVILR